MKFDDYGRAIASEKDLIETLYNGMKIADVYTEDDLIQFNTLCKQWDRPEYITQTVTEIDHSPEEEHARRSNEWIIANEMQEIDVRSFVISLCDTQVEIDRINIEMDMYEARELLPILRLMIYLVDHFRTNKIVFGVGRGSSTSSYVLFKIGIHKINSLKYDLDINEFLR